MFRETCMIIVDGVLCGEPELMDGACYDHCVPCNVCGEPISKLRETRVCDLCVSTTIQMVPVYVWPDGTWLYKREYDDLADTWRGHDYTIKYFSENATDEEIYKALSN